MVNNIFAALALFFILISDFGNTQVILGSNPGVGLSAGGLNAGIGLGNGLGNGLNRGSNSNNGPYSDGRFANDRGPYNGNNGRFENDRGLYNGNNGPYNGRFGNDRNFVPVPVASGNTGSTSGTINIRVQPELGSSSAIRLEVQPTISVSGVKELVQQNGNYPIGQQRLFFNERELSNSEVLSALGVQNNDIILLRLI
ncbi:ubiquitin family domain-containing protein [Ditylenchus destructor]|nr:ubiquitin family domain-containing protein [Ditylenchus destructor]